MLISVCDFQATRPESCPRWRFSSMKCLTKLAISPFSFRVEWANGRWESAWLYLFIYLFIDSILINYFLINLKNNQFFFLIHLFLLFLSIYLFFFFNLILSIRIHIDIPSCRRCTCNWWQLSAVCQEQCCPLWPEELERPIGSSLSQLEVRIRAGLNEWMIINSEKNIHYDNNSISRLHLHCDGVRHSRIAGEQSILAVG